MYVLSGKSISLLYFRVRNGKGFTLKQDFASVSKVSSSDDIISVIIAFLKFAFISSGNRASSNFPTAFRLLSAF